MQSIEMLTLSYLGLFDLRERERDCVGWFGTLFGMSTAPSDFCEKLGRTIAVKAQSGKDPATLALNMPEPICKLS